MSGTSDPRDEEAERALRAGMQTTVLSPEALQRIRLATEAEWRANTLDRRPRVGLMAAASVLLMVGLGAFTLYVVNTAPTVGLPMGTIARFEPPGIENRVLLGSDQPLRMGESLRVSQSIAARGNTLVSLASGGNLRVARGTEFEVEAPDKVRLESGELYVDMPPGARAADGFVITTKACHCWSSCSGWAVRQDASWCWSTTRCGTRSRRRACMAMCVACRRSRRCAR
jgi:hypothetical protein